MDTDPSANGPERPREIRASETPSLAALANAIRAQKRSGTGFVLRLDATAPLLECSPEHLLTIETRAAAAAAWRAGRELIDGLRGFPFPVVAMLEDGASDAWLEIALACSSRVAVDGKSARLRLDYRLAGLAPWLSGLWHATSSGGITCARDLALGPALTIPEALRAGLLDAIVPRGFDARALALDSPISSRSNRKWTPTNALVRSERARLALVRAGDDGRAERTIRLLEATRAGYEAYARAEQTAFADLVLSSHTRGRLTHASHASGGPGTDRAKIVIVGATTDSVRLAVRLGQRHDTLLTQELEETQFASAEVVVEAARGTSRDRRATVATLQSRASPGTIVAVSSWDEPIGNFGPGIFGLTILGNLLEVTCATEAQIPRLRELCAGLRPYAIMRDGLGRFGARLRRVLAHEVETLLQEGVSGTEIVHALVDWGFDAAFCRSLVPRASTPSPATVRAPLQHETLQARCALILVNEACRCLDDGTVRSVTEADRAAVAAIGFPSFRVGPFHYARGIGVHEMHRRLLQCQRRLGARFAPAPALLSSWT